MALVYLLGIDTNTGQQKIFDPNNDVPAIPGGFIRVLASVSAIDGKAAGDTALITAPSDRKIVVHGVNLIVESSSLVAVAGTAGVGTNGSADNIIGPTLLSGLGGANSALFLPASAGGVLADFNETINLGIDIGFTASSLVLTAELIGYYKA